MTIGRLPEKKIFPIRWWPVAVILLVAAIALGVLLVTPHPSQQQFDFHVARIAPFTSFAMLLWAFFGSRLRWKLRLLLLGVLLVMGATTAGLFRVRGVTGDLVPLVELRWGHRQLPIQVDAAATATTNRIPGAADFWW